MTPLLLTAFLLLAQGLPPLVGPLIPDTTGIVTGIVRRAGTTQPIVEAQVALAFPAESTEQALKRAVLTDLNGRFSIKGVNPGQYIVVLQAEGYFHISGEKPPTLRINEGQQTDAGTLELVPGVAISGRITAPNGQPLGAAIVQALRASYTRGQLVLTPGKTAITNDRGDYRLFWLPPGEYYLRGQYRADTPGDPERFRRVYFPGTSEEDAAVPVWINAGAEASGVDLRVPVQPLTGITVSGRVTIGGGERGEVRVTSVYAIPRNRRILVAGDHDATPNQAADAANGHFEIRNLLPGEYNLFLVTRDGVGRSRIASTSIDVADRRIENVEVMLEPQVELRGRVTLDGKKPDDRVPKGSVQLTALDGSPGLAGTTSFAIDPDPSTGEFNALLHPGRYALRSNAFRDADIYIADATIDKESVFDNGFRVRSDSEEPLEISLKSQGGVIRGVVWDPTRLRTAMHSTVVLVPERERRQNLALYKSMATTNGNFTFHGVAPGEYKLFAWASITPGAWENLLFVQRFDSRGMLVSVEAGSQKAVEIVVIP